jgi:hypothetical protein
MRRLTNKIFPHTSTKCVRLSVIFRTLQTLCSFVIFREKASTVHTLSVFFFLHRIFIERNSLVSVRIWRSVRRSWIPANLSLPSFWRTKKSIRRKPTGFGFSGLFDFLFSLLPQQIFCKENSLFSLLFYHEDLAVGSGLAQGWYLMLGEPQQKWTAKTNRTE